MTNEATVSKWGNSLAIRLPQSVVKTAGLQQGDCLAMDCDTETGDIILRTTRKKYRLSELVSGITPENRHAKADWGPPRGKETW